MDRRICQAKILMQANVLGLETTVNQIQQLYTLKHLHIDVSIQFIFRVIWKGGMGGGGVGKKTLMIIKRSGSSRLGE